MRCFSGKILHLENTVMLEISIKLLIVAENWDMLYFVLSIQYHKKLEETISFHSVNNELCNMMQEIIFCHFALYGYFSFLNDSVALSTSCASNGARMLPCLQANTQSRTIHTCTNMYYTFIRKKQQQCSIQLPKHEGKVMAVRNFY